LNARKPHRFRYFAAAILQKRERAAGFDSLKRIQLGLGA
jgi:hypothetical protein